MEFEWVLHDEVHSALSQLRGILMVSKNKVEQDSTRRAWLNGR